MAETQLDGLPPNGEQKPRAVKTGVGNGTQTDG